MQVQIIDEAPITSEPLLLSEAKEYSGIDEDYAADDQEIAGMIVSARKRIEAFLNVGLVARPVIVQFSGIYSLILPLSPTGDINTVKVNGSIAGAGKYRLDMFRDKTIYVAGDSIDYSNFFYNQNGEVEYTATSGLNSDFWEVNYDTGYVTLPEDLKLALKVETDYLIKLKGMPDNDTISSAAFVLCKHYSKNPIL